MENDSWLFLAQLVLLAGMSHQHWEDRLKSGDGVSGGYAGLDITIDIWLGAVGVAINHLRHTPSLHMHTNNSKYSDR